jgi:hypothetical protein
VKQTTKLVEGSESEVKPEAESSVFGASLVGERDLDRCAKQGLLEQDNARHAEGKVVP